MDTTNTAAETFTAADARAIFDGALAGEVNADRIAKIELLREFFTNPAFAQALADHAWANR